MGQICSVSGNNDGNGPRNVRRRVLGQPHVLLGPVNGKVTSTSANIQLEIDSFSVIKVTATPSKRKAMPAPVTVEKEMPAGEPVVFELKGLEPDTVYDITFSSKLDDSSLPTGACVVRTTKPPEKIATFHILVCSCNRPRRLGSFQNPWLTVERLCKKGTIDVMLHLGDQVYAEDWHDEATTLFEDADRAERENKSQAFRLAIEMAAAKIMQKAYRSTWTLEGTAGALAHASHWMQWSDHDVANDFTIWKTPEGGQGYLGSLMRVGMRLFRVYQRRLLEPKCEVDAAKLEKRKEVEESQFHRHGPFGVFMIDMRGARITAGGVQKPDEPFLGDTQLKKLKAAFKSKDLTSMIVTAEIPFVGDTPKNTREQAHNNYWLQFLKDHWAYRLDELDKLLKLCFAWKAAKKGREVIFLAGDIHVSGESTIFDKETKLSIRQFTTSPITNTVSRFFPEVGKELRLNERFSFKHDEPKKGKRTFLELSLESTQQGAIVKRHWHEFEGPLQE